MPLPTSMPSRDAVFNTTLFLEAILTSDETRAVYLSLMQRRGAMQTRDLLTEGALAFCEAETHLLQAHGEIGWEGAEQDFESTVWACALDAMAAAAHPMASLADVGHAVWLTFAERTGLALPTRPS